MYANINFILPVSEQFWSGNSGLFISSDREVCKMLRLDNIDHLLYFVQ